MDNGYECIATTNDSWVCEVNLPKMNVNPHKLTEVKMGNQHENELN